MTKHTYISRREGTLGSNIGECPMAPSSPKKKDRLLGKPPSLINRNYQ